MLEEINQNKMIEARKHSLSIHHSNLYRPKPLGIVRVAHGLNCDLLAVMKRFVDDQDSKQTVTIIEIYKIRPKFAPELRLTLIEHEELTGIVWIEGNHLLTVSKNQTINIYSIKTARRVSTTITDYGPILCMNYFVQKKLLLTGTEYGYVAAYKICTQTKTVEPLSKMVKIGNPINSLDFTICETTRPTKPEKKKASPIKYKPGKRKRNDSDDSDDGDESAKDEKDFLSSTDMTIYGASKSDVVIWDYHKKTIIETIKVGSCSVLSILALNNGDIVVGDSTGDVIIFDHKSFTRKHTIKAIEFGVICLAKDEKDRCIIASGLDPTIAILKQDETDNNDYLLFDRIELHTHDVTSIVMLGRKEFFTGGLDGILVRFRLRKDNGEKKLLKHITLPNYSDKIKFFDKEMMIQYDKSLVIWKLPKPSLTSSRKDSSSQEVVEDDTKPVKHLLIKARTFIHSSTFSSNRICYSSGKGVHIFSRSDEKMTSCRPDKALLGCNALELCCGDRYLAAAAQKKLYLIDLNSSGNACELNDSKDNNLAETMSFSIIGERSLKSIVMNLIYSNSLNQLIVACGPTDSYLYTFNLNSTPTANLPDYVKFHLKNEEISFISHNGAVKKHSSIYAYTVSNRLLKIDMTKLTDSGETSKLSKIDKVHGLPNDTYILGMVIISKDSCILYDSHRMFKVDMIANEVVNLSSDYNYIIKMDNFVFNKSDQVALVELTPDDYIGSLPPVKPRKKFGK